jgi:hypothetical protein
MLSELTDTRKMTFNISHLLPFMETTFVTDSEIERVGDWKQKYENQI